MTLPSTHTPDRVARALAASRSAVEFLAEPGRAERILAHHHQPDPDGSCPDPPISYTCPHCSVVPLAREAIMLRASPRWPWEPLLTDRATGGPMVQYRPRQPQRSPIA